jgi:hypothetical protein
MIARTQRRTEVAHDPSSLQRAARRRAASDVLGSVGIFIKPSSKPVFYGGDDEASSGAAPARGCEPLG